VLEFWVSHFPSLRYSAPPIGLESSPHAGLVSETVLRRLCCTVSCPHGKSSAGVQITFDSQCSHLEAHWHQYKRPVMFPWISYVSLQDLHVLHMLHLEWSASVRLASAHFVTGQLYPAIDDMQAVTRTRGESQYIRFFCAKA